MRHCRSFQQLSLILGTALGLAIGQYSMAAPKCSSVLTAPSSKISNADIDRVIENIARMKLSTDLEKAAGQSSATKNISPVLYKAKFAELVSQLRGTKTQAEIKSLISQKIIQLQERDGRENQENRKKEDEARKETEKLLVNDIYTKKFNYTERIKLPDSWNFEGSTFEYVAKLDSILLIMKDDTFRKIALLDLKTKQFTNLFDSKTDGEIVNFSTSVNGRFFTNMIVDAKGESKILVFDTMTAQESQIAMNTSMRAFWHQMSPSGKSLLMMTQRSGQVFAYSIDVATGKPQELKGLSEKMNSPRSLNFINDHEIVFADAIGDHLELIRYNTITETSELIYKNRSITDVKIDRESKNVFVRNAESPFNLMTARLDVGTIDSTDVTIVPTYDSIKAVYPLPNFGLLVNTFVDRAKLMTALPGEDLKIHKSIDHQATNGDNDTTHDTFGATVDSRSEILFIGYSPRNKTNNSHIDIWKPKD